MFYARTEHIHDLYGTEGIDRIEIAWVVEIGLLRAYNGLFSYRTLILLNICGIIGLLQNIKPMVANNKYCYLEGLMIRIKLSEVLGRKKMTRKRLAELTNVRPNTIGDLYNEKIRKIDIDILDRICCILECDINDLLEYHSDDEET